MPRRLILYADGALLRVFRGQRGLLQLDGRFAANQEGLADFAAYLQRQRGGIFTLLVDVPEEGFQLEDIPHCGGKDRQAIVARKLAQYFYGTPFAVAASHGRLKTGRRDERLLLMALTRPQQLDPWIDALRANRIALTGMYTLPQVIGKLVPHDHAEPLLLITETHKGLRQTFFTQRQLRFSRLTALATGSAEEAALAAALEAGKIHQYLLSQRLIEPHRPLATRILAHPARMAELRARCRDTTELRFEFVDLLQEAQRAGLRTPLVDSQAEPLFCHLLAQAPPQEQFAPPAARAAYRLWQSRFALKASGAVILAAGMLFAAKQGLELLATRAQTAQIQQQVRSDQQRYDAVLQALPRVPLSTDALRALIDKYDQIDRRAIGPAPLLAQLSQSLDAYPAIALEHLEWSVADSLTPAAAAAAANSKSAAAVPPHLAQGPYAHAVVTAKLPLGMVGDQRGQLKLVADFTQHMGSRPDTLVTVLNPPVDTQSGKTLRSGDETRVAEAPRFVFRLTRKL